MESRFKIFSDPVHGFISVPKNVILELIQSPEVQRLRRIRQLGIGYLVFPGADHTRFGHALGAMALMQDALSSLTEKGTPISAEEHTAALVAALLHDIGHGPFSHTLETTFIDEFNHETMSRALLADLNERTDGRLELAIRIFDDTYDRPFFHQLVSSQLDMDRLDYLRRDSYFTGVVEGEVGVQRIIKTLRVQPIAGGPDSSIVIEFKGVYAVESFLIARRLMYWQVYLHKTVVSGDHLLRSIFQRIRWHIASGRISLVSAASPALLFFLNRQLDESHVQDPEVRAAFRDLDDSDVIYSIKQWRSTGDQVLADLCRRFLERDFFRVSFLGDDATDDEVSGWRSQIAEWLVGSGRSSPETAAFDADSYLSAGRSRHSAYENIADSIRVLDREGRTRELSETTDTAAVQALTRFVVKPYVCYPKEVPLAAIEGSWSEARV